MALSARAAFLPAVLLSPFLLVRNLLPRSDLTRTVAYTGATCIALNVALPVFLHLTSTPIVPTSLAAAHWVVALVLVLVTAGRRLTLLPPRDPHAGYAFLLSALLALLVVPVTHLAGIDTYKWQGLATNVRVEQCIPWLIHPISLLGFTPRSYPSAQPLMLATMQMLGGLGVDAGFFILSVFTGTLGVFAAACLGRRIFGSPRDAAWFTFLYALSPVFIRYAHWATGRGFFLALLPLLLLGAMDLPRLRAALLVLLSILLLPLSHKTGLVAAVLIPGSLVLLTLVPRRDRRLAMAAAALPFLAAALWLAPSAGLPGLAGRFAGFLQKAVTRFGWYLPAAGLALVGPNHWFSDARRRRLVPAALLTFPIAFTADMYGAMLALPFLALAATIGLGNLSRWRLRHARVPRYAAAALTMAMALAVLLRRSRAATPAPVWRAAQFLERYDPTGPYCVEAPGRTRVQIHAYVSGCPRFDIAATSDRHVQFRLPSFSSFEPRELMDSSIRALRNVLSLPALAVAWYGRNPSTYYVIHDGQGSHPADAGQLNAADGVEIYGPVVPSQKAR